MRSYVPVSVDYTDLLPIMAFFRGDTKGNGAHDHLAKEIADAGKMWTEDMWHWSDMQVCEYSHSASSFVLPVDSRDLR